MSAFPLSALRTTLVNTFSSELILSFLFSNTLFPYKTRVNAQLLITVSECGITIYPLFCVLFLFLNYFFKIKYVRNSIQIGFIGLIHIECKDKK